MFWFYVPLTVTALTILFYAALNMSQDKSGAGMVGFFLLIPIVLFNLVSWLLYFMLGMLFGIR